MKMISPEKKYTYIGDSASRYEIDGFIQHQEIPVEWMDRLLSEGYGYRSIMARRDIANLWGMRYCPDRVTLKPGDDLFILTKEGPCYLFKIKATLEEAQRKPWES